RGLAPGPFPPAAFPGSRIRGEMDARRVLQTGVQRAPPRPDARRLVPLRLLRPLPPADRRGADVGQSLTAEHGQQVLLQVPLYVGHRARGEVEARVPLLRPLAEGH